MLHVTMLIMRMDDIQFAIFTDSFFFVDCFQVEALSSFILTFQS